VDLVATPGASDANSYVIVEEADAYFGARLGADAWEALETEADKAKALIAATRRVDQEQFRGRLVKPLVGSSSSGPKQALQWPRWVTLDDGTTLDHTQIPRIVKDGTCEEALALLAALADDQDLLANTGLEAFKNVAVGSMNVTPRHSQKAGDLPEAVRRILRPVLATSRGSVRFVRA
jgi:hypothetical protein